MNKLKKLFSLTLVVLIAMSVPSAAEAASRDQVQTTSCTFSGKWLTDANCTTNRSTVYTFENVSLRVGYYNGYQYGWAKFNKEPKTSKEVPILEVSFDGGQTVADSNASYSLSYTWAYPASNDRNRKFRACYYVWEYPVSCGPWW